VGAGSEADDSLGQGLRMAWLNGDLPVQLAFLGSCLFSVGHHFKNCVLLYDMMGIEWESPIRIQSHFPTTKIVPNDRSESSFYSSPLPLFVALTDCPQGIDINGSSRLEEDSV
jgi:hypothetical protein